MHVFGLGAPELAIILVVVLIIFGPKNLPKLGALLGKGVKNLRDGLDGKDKETTDETVEETAEELETPVLEEAETPKRKVKVIKKTTEETVESENEE